MSFISAFVQGFFLMIFCERQFHMSNYCVSTKGYMKSEFYTKRISLRMKTQYICLSIEEFSSISLVESKSSLPSCFHFRIFHRFVQNPKTNREKNSNLKNFGLPLSSTNTLVICWVSLTTSACVPSSKPSICFWNSYSHAPSKPTSNSLSNSSQSLSLIYT